LFKRSEDTSINKTRLPKLPVDGNLIETGGKQEQSCSTAFIQLYSSAIATGGRSVICGSRRLSPIFLDISHSVINLFRGNYSNKKFHKANKDLHGKISMSLSAFHIYRFIYFRQKLFCCCLFGSFFFRPCFF